MLRFSPKLELHSYAVTPSMTQIYWNENAISSALNISDKYEALFILSRVLDRYKVYSKKSFYISLSML